MRRAIVLAAVFAFSLAATAQAATQCRDPKTHRFVACPRPATVTPASNATSTSHPPHCTKGKVCGNTCIAATAVCHAH